MNPETMYSRWIQSLYGVLDDFDLHDRERNQTNAVALETFGKREAWKCAFCHRPKTSGNIRYIAAAHIQPLEEGGITEPSNLVLLCEGTMHINAAIDKALQACDPQNYAQKTLGGELSEVGIDVQQIGCHKLFDYGLIARVDVRSVRRKELTDIATQQVRNVAFQTTLDKLDGQYARISGRTNQFKRLEENLPKQLKTSSDFEKMRAYVYQARRFVGQRAMLKARRSLEKMETAIKKNKDWLTKKNYSLFHYENALYLMVKQPDPNISGALDHLERSCENEPKESIGWAMSRSEWVHARILAHAGIIDNETFQSLRAELDNCFNILKPSTNHETDIVRWKVNSQMHFARLHLKAGFIQEAKRIIRETRKFRESLTVKTGWTVFQGTHLNTIEGVLLARSGDYLCSLNRLARAMGSMNAWRGKRPEGYLDIARSAAWVFARMGCEQRASEMRRLLAQDIKDGRSGIWVTSD